MGDTAAMGLARLSRSISEDTDAVILELGANDMLRGNQPSVTRMSLAAILRHLQARHIDVLLCGVRTQPEGGADYRKAFAAMFADLAREYNLTVLSGLRRDVCGRRSAQAVGQSAPDSDRNRSSGYANVAQGGGPD